MLNCVKLPCFVNDYGDFLELLIFINASFTLNIYIYIYIKYIV